MAQLFLMFAVLCCIPSALVAIQPYTPQYENPLTNMGRWTEYPELSGKGLRCLEIDDSDTVWFGTETGIYSYDGLDWKEYPISDDLLGLGIDILVFAGDGSLYAGSNVALSKLQEGAWERVLPSSPDVELPITGICPTGFSGLWISTPRGVLAYNGDVWRAYADSSGTAWLGENTTSIKVHTVPELSLYEHVLPAGHPTGVAGPYREFNPIGLLEDSNGRIWLGQALGDVHSFNVDSNGAPYDWVNHSMVDGFIARGTGDPPRIRFLEFADEVWVVSGTHDPIIAYKNGVGRQVDLRSESNHPGTNLNTSAMINADGSIWVAGFQLQIWQDGAWTFYGPRGAPKNALPLARRRILSMAQARDGTVWFAQRKGNVFRLKYNSNQWTTYADLFYCGETRSGLEYFLEKTGRVIEHDLSFDRWLSYGPEDGVMEFPKVLHLSSSDLVWLAGTHGGIAATANLVDGKWFVSTHPTLSWSINGGGAANTIGETSDGTLWFPGTGWFLDENTMSRFSGGIKTFNGVNWELLPWVDMWGLWKEYRPLDIAAEEGTLRNYYGFGQDIDGQVWMGTVGGLYSYENRRLRRATHPQAGHSTVQVIRSTTEGILWVGTRAQGVFTYDGKSWTNHGENDGLVGDNVRDLVEGPDESIWVSTTEGLSRYDGSTWTPQALFPHKEGGTSRILINERGHVFQSHRSGAWGVRGWPGIQPVEWDSTFFSTIRYIPDSDAPETEIVRAEESVSVEGNTVITWSGRDLWRETPDDRLEYAYRMDGGDWSAYSTSTHETFFSLPSGHHTFEVRARDRDYNVDPTPAVISFVVAPPVWQEPWFICLVVVFVGSLSWQGRRVVARTRERNQAREALLREAQEELETAQAMQRKLLPKENPDLPGVDVAGRCTPCTHVGGDFIKYAEREDRLYISVADVTGHGMEAAIPVVMFSGILDNHLDEDHAMDSRFTILNRSLCRNLHKRSFVCFSMGEFDIPGRRLRLGNAGCPSPYHFRASVGALSELEHNHLPLGALLDSEYGSYECSFDVGDYFVFFSDGLVEEENASGEFFGYPRMERVLSGLCSEGLPAQGILDGLYSEWETFKGTAPQGDDVTCAVVRIT